MLRYLSRAGIAASLIVTCLTFASAPASAVAPANDNIANATILQGPSGSVQTDNSEATAEEGEPDYFFPARKSVWYRYVAPTTGTVKFSTELTPGHDTGVVVLEGTDFSAQPVAGSDDFDMSAGIYWSRAAADVEAGHTYLIGIDSWNDGQSSPLGGPITLTWSYVTRPAMPGNPVVTQRDGAVRVSWTKPGSLGTGSFNRYIAQNLTQTLNGEEPAFCRLRDVNVTTCDIQTTRPATDQWAVYVVTTDAESHWATAQLAQAPTLPTAPPAPTATAGNAKATVAWPAPSTLGNGTFQKYEVATAAGAVKCTTTSPTNRTCVAGALTNGTSYQFKVRAVTSAGNGPWSPLSNAVVPDGTSPAVSLTAPAAAVQLADAAVVKWTASDTGTGLSKFQVRWQRAAYNGGFGALQYPAGLQALGPAARQASVPLAKGYTYCFSVRGQDKAGNWSAWTAARCTAQPLDDKAAAIAILTAGWTRPSDMVFWQGTVLRAKALNSAVGVANAQATRIALLVNKCPTCGQVKVTIGSRVVGTVNTYAAGNLYKQWVQLPVFALTTGQVRLRVVTSGKPVSIDAVAISRR